MKLPNQLARWLANERQGAEHEGYRVVSNASVDAGRWTTIHLLIIERVGELGFWGAYYERGATEYQDISPFEDDGPEITFERYRPRTVTVIEFDKVPDDE